MQHMWAARGFKNSDHHERETNNMNDQRNGKTYQRPIVKDWGSVTDLTACGNTTSATDAKGGSQFNCSDMSQ